MLPHLKYTLQKKLPPDILETKWNWRVCFCDKLTKDTKTTEENQKLSKGINKASGLLMLVSIIKKEPAILTLTLVSNSSIA